MILCCKIMWTLCIVRTDDLVGDKESSLWNGYWRWLTFCGENSTSTNIAADKVRVMFMLSRADAERLKHLVTAADDKQQCHISTFVVGCALIWVCLIKSRPLDCRNRFRFSVSMTYLWNCLIAGCVIIQKSEAIGDNGIILAAKALGKRIKAIEKDWTDNGAWSIAEGSKTGCPCLTGVAESPNLRVYETDSGGEGLARLS